MNTLLTFIGSFEKLPETANLGDLCVIDGKEYIYTNTWQEIGMNYASWTTTESDIARIENQTLIIDF